MNDNSESVLSTTKEAISNATMNLMESSILAQDISEVAPRIDLSLQKYQNHLMQPGEKKWIRANSSLCCM